MDERGNVGVIYDLCKSHMDVNNHIYIYMGVSKNNGTPNSSILIGFSLINHPFWGTIFLKTPIYTYIHHV